MTVTISGWQGTIYPMSYSNLLLAGVAAICRRAGDAILEVYEREDFDIKTKSDQSPLTAADLAAHHIIVDGLSELAPDIPILSEESDEIPFSCGRPG